MDRCTLPVSYSVVRKLMMSPRDRSTMGKLSSLLLSSCTKFTFFHEFVEMVEVLRDPGLWYPLESNVYLCWRSNTFGKSAPPCLSLTRSRRPQWSTRRIRLVISNDQPNHVLSLIYMRPIVSNHIDSVFGKHVEDSDREINDSDADDNYGR